LNIEVITTTDNTLKKTGFGSRSSCVDLVESIQRAGNSVRLTVCECLDDLQAVVARKPDLVVLTEKFMPIKDAQKLWFSEYFALNKITFSGCDRETLKFDSDKASAKLHLANMRIKTARHFTALPKQFLSQGSLPLAFPLFIKSIDATNGNGIDDLSYVNNFAEFETKVLSICTLDEQPALVEEYLAGRDFSVAIICNSNGEMTMSAVEILRQGDKQQEADCCLQVVDPDDSHKVNELAKAAFLGLGLRDFALIDVRMNNYGQCFFMDANLVPNMTPTTSYFLRACEIANNLSYDQVICLMLEEFSTRARGDKIHNIVLKQRNLHWPRASVTKGL
jgi:D-alanine-D-alanine ligase